MERERELRGTRDPFDIFGGLGNFGGFTSSLFGRNPFDDPFFTRPFGDISRQATPSSEQASGPISKGPVIHEISSDDEIDGEKEREDDKDDSGSRNKEPFVDYPDEEPDIGKGEHGVHRADLNKAEAAQARTFQFHSCKVTYGGVDGAYYTTSSIRRIGDDGVLMEECKEADKRTGEAKHRISKGIHDKGHSLTRKLNSDGKVETLQTLHNLNEDELEPFENSWKGNAGKYLPWRRMNASTTGARTGAEMLASSERARGVELGNSSNRTQPKKVVRINIE